MACPAFGGAPSRVSRGQVPVIRQVGSAMPSAASTGVTRRVVERGLEQGEFFLEYQPVVDLADGAVRGAEALLRWRHPHRGVLAPAAFLPDLERLPVMADVTAHVLRTSCQALASRGPADWTLSVNIAVADAARAQLVDDVQQALTDARLESGRLVLEVTETGIPAEQPAMKEVLGGLRETGVGVSLDDFGTGYSSLRYLRELPLTELKLDSSFITDVERNQRDARIVHVIVRLAEAFEIDVVAEGIEAVSQASFLRQVGCMFGQGYLWGPPGPLEQINPSGLGSPSSRRGQLPTSFVSDHIRRLATMGLSEASIAAALNRDGLTTPDGRQWHRVSVARTIAAIRRAEESRAVR
jgi:EAL domain-containing protein (putative c-di-GMP-specific phosphodiesterase class I)